VESQASEGLLPNWLAFSAPLRRNKCRGQSELKRDEIVVRVANAIPAAKKLR
jgi:hypothetical protein